MSKPQVVLSFDIEEHHRIEAAHHLTVPLDAQDRYRQRMEERTLWLLEQLRQRGLKATFFVVGELARSCNTLVRAIAWEGHEVASHGWDHRRVLDMTREEFRRDVRDSKAALEDATGQPVVGYRAPTFSIVRRTAWAIDILAEEGYQYDSSIYPVRHDRYGIPDAPLTPFVIPTASGPIVEVPPLTLRSGWLNLPVGGGGYFRLLPTWLMHWGIRQMTRRNPEAPAVLYFHPWEFDTEQEQLPLGFLSRMRTYRGIQGSVERLGRLMDNDYHFRRLVDVVTEGFDQQQIPTFALNTSTR